MLSVRRVTASRGNEWGNATNEDDCLCLFVAFVIRCLQWIPPLHGSLVFLTASDHGKRTDNSPTRARRGSPDPAVRMTAPRSPFSIGVPSIDSEMAWRRSGFHVWNLQRSIGSSLSFRKIDVCKPARDRDLECRTFSCAMETASRSYERRGRRRSETRAERGDPRRARRPAPSAATRAERGAQRSTRDNYARPAGHCG
jgi:hypothetical protein